MANRLFIGLRGDTLRHRVRDRQYLREISQQGEAKVRKPPPNLSVIEPSRVVKRFAAVVVIAYALITMVPMLWIFVTSFKSPQDSIAYPPKILFQPSMEAT